MSESVYQPRRAFRDPDDRLLGGVAAGLATHLALTTLQVRIAFIVLAVLSGFGVIVYAALWVLLPVRDELATAAPGMASATRRGFRSGAERGKGRELTVAVSLCLIGFGAVAFLQNAGLWISGRIFWPLLVAGVGVGLLWWQSDQGDRTEWLTAGRGWKAWMRIVLGVFLVGAAIWLALFQAGVSGAIDDAVGAVLLAVVGIALVIGPWLFRMSRDLRVERRERIRSQERADVAAHLHDSVLQTLALIQRQAGDPQSVAHLARTQERELRTWLFDSVDPASSTLKAALQRDVADVEDVLRVPIELVVVGDTAMTEPLAAVVAAAREAMVNAAKHSGAARIDVYAEVAPSRVEVGVRDRGKGFELAEVADDRQGVRGSIIERMARHGGGADVRSAPGDGTDIRIWMPVKPAPTTTRPEEAPR
jgi:signal transduction histidine kinase